MRNQTRRKGRKGRWKAVRAISVLSHVGFRDRHAHEIEVIADFLGIRLDEVFDSAKELIATGIVRIQGSFLQVTPALLANYEALFAIRGKAGKLNTLLLQLSSEAQRRLIRKLRSLHGEELAVFWNEFFDKGGPFEKFNSTLNNLELLRSISIAIPDRVARFISDGLSGLSFEEKIALTGGKRRGLMWTLEELLFRKASSESALRSIAVLGETENETIANNATGVFCECFHPMHPQFPLSLDRLLRIVQETLGESQSDSMHILGVKAIKSAFDQHGAILLRRSEGATPLDVRSETTWGELWHYLRQLALLAWDACTSERESVAREACSALPRILYGLVAQTPPLEAAKFSNDVTKEILNDKLNVSLNELCADLALSRKVLDSYVADHPRKAEAQEAANLIDEIVSNIESSSFEIRLKRWIGGWQSGEHETDASGNLVFESDKKIEALAEECVSNQDLLTSDLLNWLVSPDAKQSWNFFYSLGRSDKTGQFRQALEELGKKPEGARAFGAYFGGLATHSAEMVQNRLDDVAHVDSVCGMSIVYATAYRQGYRRSVDRIRLLIAHNRIDPENTARLLSGGRWSENLTTGECFDLLSSIAGDSLSYAGAVIDFLAMWGCYYKKPLEGALADLGWKCLEAMPDRVDVYDADLLAAVLLPNDADRGFRLFETMMNQHYGRKGWQPIDHHATRKFWDALRGADKTRLLRLVFRLNFKDATRAQSISWHLPDLINWEEDQEILSAVALESEMKALLVLQCVSRAGLWPLAFEVLQKFPDSKAIRNTIVSRASHDQEVIVGPQSLHYEKCTSEVTAIIDDSSTPPSVRGFLRELRDRYLEAARRAKRLEEDEQVNW